MAKVQVLTVAGAKIHPDMRVAQAAVVEKLLLPHGFEHVVIENDDHAGALDTFFARRWDSARHYVLLDVDCVPSTIQVVIDGLQLAQEEGALVGIAQSANHIDRDEVYVGPAFMIWNPAILRDNRCSFRATEHADVAQTISRRWPATKFFLFPQSCRVPQWTVMKYPFGPGTWYGRREVYHEFEARDHQGVPYFVRTCEDILRAA